MAITFGFYNSLNGDRKYTADQFASIFDGLIVDGVFASIGTAFAVKATTGLTLNIGIGKAWFNHTWTLNDSVLPMEAPESEILLDRIDAVVLEINASESVRENSVKYIKGTPSSAPVRPTLIDEGGVYQYPLCYIYRKFGTSQITQADITNMVGTDAVPFVTSILKTISLDELLGQWQSQLNQYVADMETEVNNWVDAQETEFSEWRSSQETAFVNWASSQKTEITQWINELKTDLEGEQKLLDEWVQSEQKDFLAWYESMKGKLSGDVAGNLQNELDKEELKRTLLVGFDDGTKTFSDDGTVITSTASDGRTLTKTFSNGFMTMTAVLKSAVGAEQARMTKTFDADGKSIDTTVVYL